MPYAIERGLIIPVIRIFLFCRKPISAPGPGIADRINYSVSLRTAGMTLRYPLRYTVTPMKAHIERSLWVLLLPVLAGCGGSPWNNPYPATDAGRNILYSSFAERPKHPDPVQSYSSNEITFTAQIYEPPLQYHYLKRPYTLIPGVAEEVPQPRYFDARGRPLPADAAIKDTAYTVYEIKIKRGVRYQPHPAFARKANGDFTYHNLSERDLADKNVLADFPEQGTRELKARDFEYQIKRLAHPRHAFADPRPDGGLHRRAQGVRRPS